MKIELLYFEGCPNHQTALTNLKEVLADVGRNDEVEIINVDHADEVVRLRFLGSPSIRINDQDLEIVEDESTEYSLRCRRYRNGDVIEGYPSKELIRANLSTAQGLET